MSASIKNNKFYNTFTPFITKNTLTAEKTIKQRKVKSKQEQFSQSFFKYFNPCALMLIPILAITVSKTHLNRMLYNTDKEYFLAVNNEMKGGFIRHISQKCSIAKYYIINKLCELMTPLKTKKDELFLRITDKNNNSFTAKIVQNINKYFARNKMAAAQRQTVKVKKVFEKLTQNLEKQLQIFEDSKTGKIKVLLSDNVLKTSSDGLPGVIDFSLTKDGKNRSEEIRKLINEIKTLLKEEKPNYDRILQKITYSCDDVFDEGVEILIKIRKELENKNILTDEQKTLIKSMYDNFVKYKYAEIIPETKGLTSAQTRELHVKALKETFELLKRGLSGNAEEISALEKLLTEKTLPENMGILEKIRMLLKCNDIQSDLVQEGRQVALFKQYQTAEYLKTKELINDFAKQLKIADKTEKYILPNSLDEINRGKIFNHAIATVIPAGFLTGKELVSSDNTNNNKRTLFAFLTGAAAMFASHYFAICSRKVSVLYGLLFTVAAAKFFDMVLPKKKS